MIKEIKKERNLNNARAHGISVAKYKNKNDGKIKYRELYINYKIKTKILQQELVNEYYEWAKNFEIINKIDDLNNKLKNQLKNKKEILLKKLKILNQQILDQQKLTN